MSWTNYKLYSLVFIDSLCLAFLPPIMATHLMSFGGNHSILGVIAGIHAASQLISGPLIDLSSFFIGKKSSLLLTLFIYFVTYYFLGITRSCLIFIVLRMCFALTNQTQSICKSIAAIENAALIDNVYNLMTIVGVAGLIVAPMISGLLFDYFGFQYVTMTASLLLALSLCISITLPASITSTNNSAFMTTIHQKVITPLTVLSVDNIKKYNYLILLKALYTTSLTVFFIKFSLALRLNQGLSYTTVGLTYAYQSLVTFLSSFTVNYFNPTLDEKALLQWLIVMVITLCVLVSTGNYLFYVGSFIVMAVAHGVLSRLLKEVFIHNKISDLEDSLTKVLSIVIPVIFGIACDFYGLTAFNAFVILPIICDIFIVYAFLTIAHENVDATNESTNKKQE